MIKCIRCGNEETEGTGTCSKCGFDLQAWTAAESTVPAAPGTADEFAAPAADQPDSGAYDPAAAHNTVYPGLPESGMPARRSFQVPKGLFWKVPLILVLLAIALGAVTVLGYYTFMPAKWKILTAETMTFLARYNDLNDTYTQYEESVVDRTYKGATAHSGQFGMTIDNAALTAMGMSEEEAAQITSVASSATIDYSVSTDMPNKKMLFDLNASVSGNPILGFETRLDGNRMLMRIPELNATWLEFNATTYASQLQGLGSRFDSSMTGGLDDDLSALPGLDESTQIGTDPWISATIYDKVKIDRKELRSLMTRYLQLAIKTVPDKNMTSSGSETISVLGEEISCQKYQIVIDPDTQKELVLSLLDEMKSDDALYEMSLGNIKKIMDIVAEGSPELKEQLGMTSMLLNQSAWKEAIVNVRNSVTSSWPEGMPDITMEVYVHNVDVVRHAILIPTELEAGGGSLAFDWLRKGDFDGSAIALLDNEMASFSMKMTRTRKSGNAIDRTFALHGGQIGMPEMVSVTCDMTETAKDSQTFDTVTSLKGSLVDPTGSVADPIQFGLESIGTMTKDKQGVMTAADQEMTFSLSGVPMATDADRLEMKAGFAARHEYDATVSLPELGTDSILVVEGASDADLTSYMTELQNNLTQLQSALMPQ